MITAVCCDQIAVAYPAPPLLHAEQRLGVGPQPQTLLQPLTHAVEVRAAVGVLVLGRLRLCLVHEGAVRQRRALRLRVAVPLRSNPPPSPGQLLGPLSSSQLRSSRSTQFDFAQLEVSSRDGRSVLL